MQDGAMAFEYSKSNTNYKPNSLDCNRPREVPGPCFPGMYYAGRAERTAIKKTDDFIQARERYMSLCCDEQDRMVDAIGYELAQCNPCIRKRQLALFEKVSTQLSERIQEQIYLFETNQKC